MKVSAITDDAIYSQLRLEADDVDTAEASYITALKTAAINYATGHTGLTETQLDDYEDITVAVLTLITDMYDHRLMYADKNYANRTVETILNMHAVNLMPKDEEVTP